MGQLFSALLQPQNRDVARVLVAFAVMVAVVPVLAFYLGMNVFFLGWEEPTMWSGFLAAGSVNLLMGLYAYKAVREDAEDCREVTDKIRRGDLKTD